MSQELPKTMRAVVLDTHHEDLREAIRSLHVAQREVPQPAKDQVLVRMAAAPCNPSDLVFLQGNYGRLKSLPSVPGWEGAGTVVAAGGGMYAHWLENRRVAVAIRGDRDGTWAEYALAEAGDCIPLASNVTSEQGATLIVNPLTALGLLETAQRAGSRAAIQTAAASQLGRMLIQVARDASFPIVSLVRRGAQVDLLQSLGAEHVLNTSEDNWRDRLRELAARLGATSAFDAVGGHMTGELLSAMPERSTVYVYGALSEEACSDIDPLDLIFRRKQVQGFFLSDWLTARNRLRVLWTARRAQRLIGQGQIGTHIRRRLGLDEVVEGLLGYVDEMTAGKMLIVPHGQQKPVAERSDR
ncbi:MAG: zinc-binding dehydrogenase [Pirellulales bacterium]